MIINFQEGNLYSWDTTQSQSWVPHLTWPSVPRSLSDSFWLCICKSPHCAATPSGSGSDASDESLTQVALRLALDLRVLGQSLMKWLSSCRFNLKNNTKKKVSPKLSCSLCPWAGTKIWTKDSFWPHTSNRRSIVHVRRDSCTNWGSDVTQRIKTVTTAIKQRCSNVFFHDLCKASKLGKFSQHA